MKAAVIHGKKDIRLDDVADPIIEEPTDAIIRVTATAICGSDLHMYGGMMPQPRPMTMGHEFMGVVEALGADVTNLKIGDRVVVPFPIACGGCFFCSRGLTAHCENTNEEMYGPEGALTHDKGGGIFGYTDLYGGYDGGQAEAVRVPHADFGPRVVPEGISDEQALFLTDIMPTGWTGVAWAQPAPGDTIAVFGCGPVGLMAMKSAWLQGAGRVIGVDLLPYRLKAARDHANAETIDAGDTDPVEAIRAMTGGRGADVCIDAVGMEPERGPLDKLNAAVHMQRGSDQVLINCVRAVRRGGAVSIMGVYASPYDNFPIDKIFDKGLRIAMGQAPVHACIDQLMELVVAGKLIGHDIITHRMALADVAKGYEIFHKHEDGCVKVVLKP